jgi:hypothetical protein
MDKAKPDLGQINIKFKYDSENIALKDAMERSGIDNNRVFMMTLAYLINDGTIKINGKFREAQTRVW